MGRATTSGLSVSLMHGRSEIETCVPEQENNGGGKRGEPPALAGTREYQQSDWCRWQAENVKVLWNLECPVGLS